MKIISIKANEVANVLLVAKNKEIPIKNSTADKMMNLGEVLGKLMSSGHSVKLKGIGTFYYTCRSEGTGVVERPDAL